LTLHNHVAQVKATVDSFGAHGIDIDYEAEAASQWEVELVRTNVIRYLRQAMPSPQYLIYFTIGGMCCEKLSPSRNHSKHI
jgi:chitinase